MRFQQLQVVDIVRRGYGRRYSSLPVDHLDHEGFTIDCSAGYLRPTHFDLRQGDLVQFRQGERYVEAQIAAVQQHGDLLRVSFEHVQLLPPDYFPF